MFELARHRSILAPVALAAMAAGLGGCTIVRVGQGAGVHSTYYPGVAVIRITRADAVQVVDVESVGAAVIGNGANFGWSHSQIALVPPGRCQFLAWQVSREQVAELRRLLGPTEICNREGEGERQ